MYPIRLNLMSQKKQQYARGIMTMGFIKNTLAIVFIVLCCFAIFSIISQAFLQSQFADITLQSLRTHTSAGEINAKIQKINAIIKQASAIQDQYTPWSIYVTRITAALPKEVNINHISLKKKEQLFEISGSVPSRDSLMKLKEQLEALDEIAAVNIPLSNLTKQDDIPFTLSVSFVF